EKSDMQYGANEHMCIDARRNIYLTDTEENAVFIFKKENGYAYGEKIENSVAENVLSLSVDFGGGLFALEPEGIAYYSNGNRYEISLCFNGLDLSDVSSFSLSFSDKSAFITLTGDELLRYSLSLPNMSVSDIEIPADFAINGYTAEQENLTIFETVNDAELFGIATVNPEDNIFEYTGFNALPDKQFVKVCALTLKETYETDERTLSLFVVSDGKLYIAFTEYLFNVTETCVTEPEYVKGYVATNVNAYYLPVITDGAEYALRTGNAILRLDKKTEILPVKNINFEGKDYLYSKILTESGEVYGYIPKTFTVEVLSEHANGEEFVLRKVTKTTLYKDAEMTEKIIDIENVTVRVYTAHSTDKTSYISVDTENGILFGYVETSAVKAQESYSIRNAVIIVAVSLSVFITSLFFILKKYKG
ncbi:MAG: hypothetical protein J6Y43_01355, partial [Clostridia bacterium]|nr:hypothetical protein [Clostridia bacterium]